MESRARARKKLARLAVLFHPCESSSNGSEIDRPVQLQFKNKLAERLVNPHVPASQLPGFKNHYKIKLRASGYRLVYEVQDEEICVLVIAVGKRDKSDAYKKADRRQKG